MKADDIPGFGRVVLAQQTEGREPTDEDRAYANRVGEKMRELVASGEYDGRPLQELVDAAKREAKQ